MGDLWWIGLEVQAVPGADLDDAPRQTGEELVSMLGLAEALLLLAQPSKKRAKIGCLTALFSATTSSSPCGQGVLFRLGALLGERDLASQLLLARAERFEVGGP